jgi:hypothetical protein
MWALGLDLPRGDKDIPTEVSSIDHKAILIFPSGLRVARARIILTKRTMEKETMTIPREKVAPIPSFCFKDILRPTRRRIGSTPTIISVAMSILVATQIELMPFEISQASGSNY